jgi:hypothetical protein
MDFDGAIQAHTNWKLRLFSFCKGTLPEKIDMQELEKDNLCALGKWIHGEGQGYAADPKGSDLVQAHAAFHRAAASIALMIERGRAPAAQALLNSRDSEFGKLSLKVVGHLMDLRSRYSGT